MNMFVYEKSIYILRICTRNIFGAFVLYCFYRFCVRWLFIYLLINLFIIIIIIIYFILFW